MDIEKLAREAGLELFGPDAWGDSSDGASTRSLARFAALVAQACAKVCDELSGVTFDDGTSVPNPDDCARAIRAQVPPQSDDSDR